MNLPGLLSKALPFIKINQENEYFFALNVASTQVQAAIWGVEGNKLRIIRTSSTTYSSDDDLIEAANYALDDALADFQPEPTKILFGVPDDWLQDDNIKPAYLKLLQRMVKELDIEPLAYVSMIHAISHFTQKTQGVPMTAVLIEIGDPTVASVVKGGKILATGSHKRSMNLPEDIEKILLGFSDVEVLPSKILIYGYEKLDKYKEELLSFSWMAQLPFLHLPKIEELAPGTTVRAVCLAGASELNPDTIYSADKTTAESGEIPSHHKVPIHRDAEVGNLHEVGFTTRDVDYKMGVKEKNGDLRPQEDFYDSGQSMGHGGATEPKKQDMGMMVGKMQTWISIFGNPIKLIILSAVVLCILAAVLLFVPKAHVSMFVDMQLLEKESLVIADPDVTKVTGDNKTIPGKIVETTVSGMDKGEGTGKKKIGDSAKGTAIVYNKTSASKAFSQGTVFVGPNNLKFTLDTSVNVASQSAVDGGISFGKATVNVTAVDIGPDSNLPAGKELSLQGQPDTSFSAKVDQALSGGVSKDVTVVTADDQKRLLAKLSSELRKKARDELQNKLEGEMKVLEESLLEKIVKSSYSKNVNDQAQEFSLNLTINYKGTAYNENDLKSIISQLVETNVPEGFELDLSKTETQASVARLEKDGKILFQAKFRAKLMPKFDSEKIKKEIAGKSFDQADQIMKFYKNVIGTDIVLKPALPGPLRRIPFLPRNIDLEITAK